MATMVDARMVKAKQAWHVLQGKLISLGWRDRRIKIALFETYVKSVFLYGCSVWGLTKLAGKGRIGVNCTRELGTFHRSYLRSILNITPHRIPYYMYLLGSPPCRFI